MVQVTLTSSKTGAGSLPPRSGPTLLSTLPVRAWFRASWQVPAVSDIPAYMLRAGVPYTQRELKGTLRDALV